jgi:hypothetical protein
MPRIPAKRRKPAKPILSDSMRYFLESGDYCLREKFPDARDRVEIFRLAHPSKAMRMRLQAIWMEHKAEVMRSWKAEKKRGLPWAAREFENERG